MKRKVLFILLVAFAAHDLTGMPLRSATSARVRRGLCLITIAAAAVSASFFIPARTPKPKFKMPEISKEKWDQMENSLNILGYTKDNQAMVAERLSDVPSDYRAVFRGLDKIYPKLKSPQPIVLVTLFDECEECNRTFQKTVNLPSSHYAVLAPGKVFDPVAFKQNGVAGVNSRLLQEADRLHFTVSRIKQRGLSESAIKSITDALRTPRSLINEVWRNHLSEELGHPKSGLSPEEVLLVWKINEVVDEQEAIFQINTNEVSDFITIIERIERKLLELALKDPETLATQASIQRLLQEPNLEVPLVYDRVFSEMIMEEHVTQLIAEVYASVASENRTLAVIVNATEAPRIATRLRQSLDAQNYDRVPVYTDQRYADHFHYLSVLRPLVFERISEANQKFASPKPLFPE